MAGTVLERTEFPEERAATDEKRHPDHPPGEPSGRIRAKKASPLKGLGNRKGL